MLLYPNYNNSKDTYVTLIPTQKRNQNQYYKDYHEEQITYSTKP